MSPLTAARPLRHPPLRGRSMALWLIVVGLLLRSAVPMLAAAAAQVRRVGVAEVCPVYGVQTHPVRGVTMSAMAATAAMSGMPEATTGHDHRATGPGDAEPGHGHHQDTASAHDHCVLTPLLGAAAVAPAGASLWQVAAGAEVHGPAACAATSPHDASRRWYALDAHPPPPA